MKRMTIFGALFTAIYAASAPTQLCAQRTERVSAQSAASPAWLGLNFEEIRSDGQLAVVVRRVHPGSPAAWVRLQPRDTVVRLNGRTASTAAFESLRLQPGDTVRLVVRRGKMKSTVLDSSRVNGTLRIRFMARPGPGEDREVVLIAARRPTAGMALNSPLWLDTMEIHSNDILRVEVLKGPAAVSKYGADASPGVIRVVTKNGEQLIRMPSTDTLVKRLERVRVTMEPELRRLQGELRRSGPELERLAETARVLAVEVGSDGRAVAGAEFTEMNAGLAGYFRGTDNGLLVLRVAPLTPAARAGLQAGDVVTRVEGQPVTTVRDLRRAVAEAKDREVTLGIVRKGKNREMRLRWER